MTPIGLAAYRGATGVLSPLASIVLNHRAGQGKENVARINERLGRPSIPRPSGSLLWLHGASVGESLALLPIVNRARATRPDIAVLVTAGTVTANALLARRLPPGVISQFSPIDTPSAVRGFLDHWRPDVGLLVESELWPNLLLQAKQRGVRLGLLSAKLSEGSLRRWLRARRSARALLDAFDLILARDEVQAARLRLLGGNISGIFDAKFGAEPLPDVRLDCPHDPWEPMILAASTHPGEEEMILEAFRRAGRQDSRARLVIVPRHPDRAAGIVALARSREFDAALQSERAASTAVIVADRLGELGGWYRRARLAIVGGSFLPGVGGHNPLEPARLGTPVVTGPHHEGWPIYREMESAGAAMIVAPDGLAEAMGLVWLDPKRLSAMAANAATYVGKGDLDAGQAIDRALDLLPP